MTEKRKQRPLLRAAAIILAAAALLFADSALRIVTTEYVYDSPFVPESFDGFRIVQLSDIHGRSKGIAEKTARAQPDIIVITGDLADDETDMPLLEELLAELAETAPVYYVSGNHEWSAGHIQELKTVFEKLGIRYLSNEYVLLEREGESIVLAGVEDPNGPRDMLKPEELVNIINEEQGSKLTVLLGHRNYWIEKYPQLEVDIILSGHAHGGIVRLPLLGGLLGTDRSFFPDHVDGMNWSGRYCMIVSRGIGSGAPIPRFLNNPEIVALTLRHAQ